MPDAVHVRAAVSIDSPSSDPSFSQDVSIAFSVDDAPSLVQVADAQQRDIAAGADHPGHLISDASGTLVDQAGCVYVPDRQCLRVRICICAHQSIAGHRGVSATVSNFRKYLTWPTLEKDVRRFVAGCLHCLRARGGLIVPRPLLHSLQATQPNQVLHFDFLFIREPPADSKHGMRYVLVLKDNFSRFLELTPSASADSHTVVQALLGWFSRYGLVPTWVSDRASHFNNSVVSEVARVLGVDHQFTTAYSPFANGRIERACREVVEALAALVSDSKLQRDDWPHMLPVIQLALNNSPSSANAGYAPITVFMGREPSNPLNIVIGFSFDSLSVNPVSNASITRHVDSLRDSFHRRVSAVSAVKPRSLPSRPGEQPVNFTVGDFVLVARLGSTARDKTVSRWAGPFRVVDTVSERSFVVEDIMTSATRTVHAQHLKLYADKDLLWTEELRAFIGDAASSFVIENIADHRRAGASWELLVHWESYSIEEASWEPFSTLFADAPIAVRQYIRSLPPGGDKPALVALLSVK